MVSKVFEKLVNYRLADHLEKFMFSDFQYGFNSCRSTADLLIEFLGLAASWDCWISYKNGYVGMLVLHLHLNPERPTCYSDRLHDFFVTIPRCYKNFYVDSFFPHTARVWNSLPRECFTLIYDLNGFK